jgi:hypothetical protein
VQHNDAIKEHQMRFAGPFYADDVHPWYASKRVARGGARLAKAAERAAPDIVSVERTARRLRAAAIASLLERFFDWIDRSARNARRRRVEEYLAQSTDAADLERRMRQLERRGELFG